MRIRTRMIAVLAAGAVVLGGATPVQAEEPDEPTRVVVIPDDLVVMTTPEAADFTDEAEALPEGLIEAVERDLGLSPEEYLAQADAAVQASQVLASLQEAGIEVVGSEMDGTELVVYVDNPELVPVIESTGATAVVGEQDVPDLGGYEFEAYDDMYGGMSWGYQTSATPDPGDHPLNGGYSRCSLGFSGWDASGNDVVLTAGHCFTSYGSRLSDPRLLPVTAPIAQNGSLGVQETSFGVLVSGSNQFGGGYDTGLLTTPAAGYNAKPQVVTYGSTDPNTAGGASDGYGAPFSQPGLPIYGKTTAVNDMPVCASGATTGFTCGTVYISSYTLPVSGQDVHGIITTACSLPGDSGGSLVTGNYALGVLSGGTWVDNDLADADSCSPPAPTVENPDPLGFSLFFALDSAAGGSNPDVTAKYGSNWEVMVDLAAPVVTSSPGGLQGSTTPISGTLAHATSGTTVQAWLNGDTFLGEVDASGGTWSLPLTSLAPGSYTYQLNALYGVWNVSAPATGSFTISGAPTATVTVTSTTHGTSTSSVGTVNPLTGTVSPNTAGTQLKLYLDNLGTSTNESGTAAATASPDGSGNWSFDLAALSLARGDYSFTVKSELTGVVTGQATGGFSIVGTHTPEVISSWGNSIAGEAGSWYGYIPWVAGSSPARPTGSLVGSGSTPGLSVSPTR